MKNLTSFFPKYGQQSVYLLLFTYLAIGFFILPDYGISMDEPIQRKHGIVSFDYVNEHLKIFPQIPRTRFENLATYDHREYGVIFQMVAYTIERLLNINNAKDVFVLRHILVFLLFWTSCYVFSQILWLRFQDWKIGLIGTLFLILSPRIFAQAFYNPKDIVFLSWVLMSMYSFLKLIEQPNIKYAILHALLCALAINARITAIFIPVMTIGLLGARFLTEHINERENINWKISTINFLKPLSTYLLATVVLTILFWAYLWANPIENLSYAFHSMKQFHWYGNVFYLGEYIPSTDIPWHYVPVWIFVTTPILYSLLFLVGLGYLFIHFGRKMAKPHFQIQDWQDFGILGYFFVPLIAVIVFQSILYNGWRHLYFIYPAFLMVGMYGLDHLISRAQFGQNSNDKHPEMSLVTPKRGTSEGVKQSYQVSQDNVLGNLLLTILILLTTLSTTYQMISIHPFQQVYFNPLIGKTPHKYFDMEYFGTSYKQGLEYLLNNSNQDKIKIHVTSPSGMINKINFPTKDINRLEFVSQNQAEYLMTNYSFPSDTSMYAQYIRKQPPFDQPPIFSIPYKNSQIIGIYHLKSTAADESPLLNIPQNGEGILLEIDKN